MMMDEQTQPITRFYVPFSRSSHWLNFCAMTNSETSGFIGQSDGGLQRGGRIRQQKLMLLGILMAGELLLTNY